jgi:hypothetical protein
MVPANQQDPTEGGGVKSGRLCLAAMVVALVLYAGVIGAGFVWDDELLFRSWLPYLDGPLSVLSPPEEIPYFTFQYFRPLVLVSYLADEQLASACFAAESHEQGRRVFFHLTPLLLHVACTGLVFLVGMRLLRRRLEGDKRQVWTAFAGALLFATHPIHVESVAWIAGRSDSLCTLAGLGALLAFLHWRERGRWPSLVVTFSLFLLALLSKEAALGLLLPGILVAAVWPADEQRISRASRLAEAGGLTIALFLYAMLRAAFGTDGATLSALSLTGDSLVRLTGAFGWYVTKVLWPYPQAVFPPDELGGLFVVAGGVAMAAVFLALLFWRRPDWHAERLALALAVGGIALPLVAAIAPVATSPVAERNLYLPSAGVCLLFALLAARVTGKRSVGASRIPLVVLVCGAVAMPAGWTVSRRIGVWEGPARFWTAAVENAPESPVAFINLGKALTGAGQLVEAEEAYRRAVLLATAADQAALAHANLGALELQRGRFDAAIDEFSLALAEDPGDATSLFNWASALAMKERRETRPARRARLLESAVMRLEAALALHPRYAKAHLLLGTILLRSAQPDVARAALETAAAIDPSSAEARRARELLAGEFVDRQEPGE